MPSREPETQSNEMRPPVTTAPNPDPTWRTLQLVREAVTSMRNELETRITAMEKAVTLQHDDYVRVPTQVDKAVGGLNDLVMEVIERHTAVLDGSIAKLAAETQEKFNGINGQFVERDTRTDQRAGDTKLVVDAAFAAAKEATAKIEAGFTKQIDGMTTIIDTKTANLDGRISDLKDSVAALRADLTAVRAEKTGGSSMLTTVVAVVVAGAAVVGLGVTLVLHGGNQDSAAVVRDLVAQNAALLSKINAAAH